MTHQPRVVPKAPKGLRRGLLIGLAVQLAVMLFVFAPYIFSGSIADMCGISAEGSASGTAYASVISEADSRYISCMDPSSVFYETNDYGAQWHLLLQPPSSGYLRGNVPVSTLRVHDGWLWLGDQRLVSTSRPVLSQLSPTLTDQMIVDASAPPGQSVIYLALSGGGLGD